MAESKTAVIAALLGNGALAALKGVAAAATGSAAMLAETFHSIADTGNEALLLLGMRLAARPPDERHPFGYGKDVYFWAFVVSVMLFTLGGAVSIWEALRHYLHPIEKSASAWSYGVLAGGAVFEAASFAIALRAVAKARAGRSLPEFWRESRDPTLLTVLMEDSAALLSLAVAAAGLWLSARTGSGLWDAAASAVIGLVLLGVAVALALENYSLLIGEAAPRRVQQEVREAIVADQAVVGIRALHTMHVGPEAILIAAEVAFDERLTAGKILEAVARLQRRVRSALGDVTDARLIVIEPAPAGGPVPRPDPAPLEPAPRA